jgi:predicted dehydrogenase
MCRFGGWIGAQSTEKEIGMEQLRVGLVGCSRGLGLVKMFDAHPEAAVTALCDLDRARLSELGKAFRLPDAALYTDYASMLEGPVDAVIIATPIAQHMEQTLAALAAGKHVLCEQTVAYTVKDCQRVADAVRRSKLVYMMAENYCYFHYVRQWRDIVEAGRIGEIYYAEGEYIHEIMDLMRNEKTGEYYWRHERPPIWYCAHTLGPILTLMKDRIVKACGVTSGFKRKPAYRDHLGYLDFELGLFKTQKGSIVKILRSQTACRPHMVWYSLYGTKGHLENGRFDKIKLDGMQYFEGMDHKDPAQLVCSPNSDPALPKEAAAGGHGTSEYFMIRDFLAAVQGKKAPAIDIAMACDMTIPGIIAHESAMQGGVWLDVPLIG